MKGANQKTKGDGGGVAHSGKGPSTVNPLCRSGAFVQQYFATSTFSHLSAWKAKAQQMAKERCLNAGAPPVAGRASQLQTSQGERSSGSASSGNTAEPPPAVAGDKDFGYRDGGGGGEEGREAGVDGKVIAHIDLDCFYASVAQRDDPTLVGRPVAVIPARNSHGTSEICSASYEARKFGITARMHIGEAQTLCPDLIVKTVNYPAYEKASDTFYNILWSFTNIVQPVSADEAYLDLSAYGEDAAVDAVRQLRDEVFSQIKVPCSAGIACSMLLARMATDAAKPNGQVFISKEETDAFLLGRAVGCLPTVGPATEKKLLAIGIATMADLRACPVPKLQEALGKKTGELLSEYSRGIDRRTFATVTGERKSVGTQISWGIRYERPEEVVKFLRDVAAEVATRLSGINARGTTIRLTIGRHKDGKQESAKVLNPGEVTLVNKTLKLPVPCSDAGAIGDATARLFEQMHILPHEVRTVALNITDLVHDGAATTPAKAANPKRSSPTGGKGAAQSTAKKPKPKQLTIGEMFNRAPATK